LPAQLNQRVGRFRSVGKSLSLGFLAYVVQTKMFYDQILLRVTGTAQFNISSEQVQSALVSFPPRGEQDAIVHFLDVEVSKLDEMVGKVELAIERLEEYRTALIASAVTGKIDVRAVVA
jgi:type I restriction enzyme S subunit